MASKAELHYLESGVNPWVNWSPTVHEEMYGAAWQPPVSQGASLWVWSGGQPPAESDCEELGSACRAGDVVKVRQVLGITRTGPTPSSLEISVSFRAPGRRSMETLFEAVPTGLVELALEVKGNQLRVDGAKAVGVGLRRLEKLQVLKLDVSYNALGAAGARLIVEGFPRGLRHLTCGFMHTKLGLEGARAIAENMPPKLEEINFDFYGCGLGDEGCWAIAHSLPMTTESLTVNLLENGLGSRGLWVWDHLIDNPGAPEHGGHYLPKLQPSRLLKQAKLEVRKYEYDDVGGLYETHAYDTCTHKTERTKLISLCLPPSPHAEPGGPVWYQRAMEEQRLAEEKEREVVRSTAQAVG